LKPSDVLEDVGVEDGSVIIIVPSKVGSKKESKISKASTVSTTGSGSSSEGGGGGSGGIDSMMKDMMKQAGVDPSALDAMPSMEDSMAAMQEWINSPLFEEYINDPEKLEQNRQMILTNPVMKRMMSMNGFDEIVNDPVKWRETMLAAVGLYKSMGSDLSKLTEGMGGMGGMGGFGG